MHVHFKSSLVYGLDMIFEKFDTFEQPLTLENYHPVFFKRNFLDIANLQHDKIDFTADL